MVRPYESGDPSSLAVVKWPFSASYGYFNTPNGCGYYFDLKRYGGYVNTRKCSRGYSVSYPQASLALTAFCGHCDTTTPPLTYHSGRFDHCFDHSTGYGGPRTASNRVWVWSLGCGRTVLSRAERAGNTITTFFRRELRLMRTARHNPSSC